MTRNIARQHLNQSMDCGCNLSRRSFAGGLAALGAGSLLLPEGLLAQSPFPPAKRIDVHHHFGSPDWFRQARAAGGGGVSSWSVQGTLADMDLGGVAKSVLSVIQPGTWFTSDQQARSLAREINDFAAKTRSDHPTRFGIFTTLSMPDVEGSLRELEYGMDVLGADGVGLFTSYGPKYLGDAAFSPLLSELNRRKAVVYVHPSNPSCCANILPGITGPSTIEYATDTTRTIASLLFSGAASRYPDIRWIWSHSGGTMPFLFSRFQVQEVGLGAKAKAIIPNGVMYEMKKFYYETAQGNTPMQLAALTKMIPISQIMFGSDYPYRPAMECVEGLEAYRFKRTDLQAIEYGNAHRIMPKLKV